MPTKTYSNLSEDKRLKIDNALKSEYKNFPWYDISVKRVIQISGIARGSFYQYFEDKDDMLHYSFELIMNEHKQKFKDNIWRDTNFDEKEIKKAWNEGNKNPFADVSFMENLLIKEVEFWRKNIILFHNINDIASGKCLNESCDSNGCTRFSEYHKKLLSDDETITILDRSKWLDKYDFDSMEEKLIFMKMIKKIFGDIIEWSIQYNLSNDEIKRFAKVYTRLLKGGKEDK
jgi:AcrR family transcriptional regulator